jgi:hypothetical protein
MTNETTAVKVIKSENGPVRINASDFIEGEHELHVADEQYDEQGVLRAAAEPEFTPPRRNVKATTTITTDTGNNGAEAGPNYDKFGVMQKKNKFYIVDGANGGKPVDDVEGIDPDGYASNQDAWNVLLSIKSNSATDNA